MSYSIIIEAGERNYSGYVPDLHGCVATGFSLEVVQRRLAEAIEFHIDGLREEGVSIPEATFKPSMLLWEGEQFWLGKVLKHPEIMTQGSTEEEVIENMKDAYRLLVIEDEQ